jgi:hypothetical protein
VNQAAALAASLSATPPGNANSCQKLREERWQNRLHSAISRPISSA